jgi:REP element-mobilizing transposase RayT
MGCDPGKLRRELKFRILGYALMPEHSHALVWPAAEANPSQIVQKLEDRTALFILKNLRENLGYPWCQKMLARVTLPPHRPPSCALSRVATGVLRHERLEPEEARCEIELHAQQSRETWPGQAPGRLAVVELEVALLE